MANQRTDTKGATVKVTLLRSPVGFDRSGFLYHGRIRAVADAARKAGLEF